MLTLLMSLCMLAAMMRASDAASPDATSQLLKTIITANESFNKEISPIVHRAYHKQRAIIWDVLAKSSALYPNATPAGKKNISKVVVAATKALKRLERTLPEKMLPEFIVDTDTIGVETLSAGDLCHLTEQWGSFSFTTGGLQYYQVKPEKEATENKNSENMSAEPSALNSASASASSSTSNPSAPDKHLSEFERTLWRSGT